MELSNINIELEYGNVIGKISDTIKKYVQLFEPTKVYIHLENKEPLTKYLKEVKGQSIGYNFGVLASIYDIEKDEYPIKVYYWESNVLKSGSVLIKKGDASVMAYISYPRGVFNGLLSIIENRGYFHDLKYNDKPWVFNKY